MARIALDSEWLASTTTGINEAAGAALEAIRDDVALTRTIHRANSLAMEFANLLCNRPTLSAVPVESWSVPHYQRLFDDVSTIERECRQIGELDAEQNLSRTIAFGTLSQRLQDLLYLATNPLPNATTGGSQVEIPSGERKGVTRTDAAFELESISDNEDTDDERSKRASDVSQKWGKRRTIKWPAPIGIDPRDRKSDLFDVVELVAVLAEAERGEVIRYGGEKKLVAKLRKIARESLPVADCIAIRARRATRTTRSLAKSKKTSRAKVPAKTRHD